MTWPSFFREREVLASFVTILIGLALLGIGLASGDGELRSIGVTFVVTGVAALGVARGLAKIGSGPPPPAAAGLLLAACLAFPGCCGAGAVRAEAIAPAVEKVSARHDAYVKADASLSEVDRRIFLRSTELLRKVLAEAREGEDGR